MLQLYRAMFRSRLEYGCRVCNLALPTFKTKLYTIQDQGIRICLGIPRTTSFEALHEEQLSTSYYIRWFALPAYRPLRDRYQYIVTQLESQILLIEYLLIDIMVESAVFLILYWHMDIHVPANSLNCLQTFNQCEQKSRKIILETHTI